MTEINDRVRVTFTVLHVFAVIICTSIDDNSILLG